MYNFDMDSMQTISTHARVAVGGHLRLDVETQLPAGEVDVVLVLVPGIPASSRVKPGFADLAGRLNWQGDTVAEQRRQRNEW